MPVIAVPRPQYAPDPDALALATVTLASIEQLTSDVIAGWGLVL
jgi:hypothetical protein